MLITGLYHNEPEYTETKIRALIFAGIKCCGINFCGTNVCDFGPKSQKLVPKMFPNSSNRKNKFRKISHFIQAQK